MVGHEHLCSLLETSDNVNNPAEKKVTTSACTVGLNGAGLVQITRTDMELEVETDQSSAKSSSPISDDPEPVHPNEPVNLT